MELLLILALVAGVTVLPVMVAARLFGAEHSGFGRALVAVVGQAGLNQGLQRVDAHPVIAIVVGVAVGAAIYAAVLGTSFFKGLIIGGVAGLIAMLVAVVGVDLLGIDVAAAI